MQNVAFCPEKKASRLAVLREIRRYPLLLSALSNVFKYKHSLQSRQIVIARLLLCCVQQMQNRPEITKKFVDIMFKTREQVGEGARAGFQWGSWDPGSQEVIKTPKKSLMEVPNIAFLLDLLSNFCVNKYKCMKISIMYIIKQFFPS